MDVDVEVEFTKWRVEFGDLVADMIKSQVTEAMPHYLYLKERRLVAPGTSARY